MRKRQASGLFLGALLAVLTTGAGADSHIVANPSSHEAAFFNELLGGRVFVLRQPWGMEKWEWANAARAYYFDTAGNEIGCNPYGEFVGHWLVWADERSGARSFTVGSRIRTGAPTISRQKEMCCSMIRRAARCAWKAGGESPRNRTL